MLGQLVPIIPTAPCKYRILNMAYPDIYEDMVVSTSLIDDVSSLCTATQAVAKAPTSFERDGLLGRDLLLDNKSSSYVVPGHTEQ